MKIIIYIDEDDNEIEDFQHYFDKYNKEIIVQPLNPTGKTTEEIVDFVFSSNCDLVAIDYDLKFSSGETPSNGDDLLTRIRDRKHNFPALIFTSDINKAMSEGFISPETMVCEKNVINSQDDDTFKNEVIKSIDFYKNQVSKYKNEFSLLRERQSKGEKMNNEEKRRIVELNNILGIITDSQNHILEIENQEEELGELGRLIDLTQKILDNIKSK